MSKRTATVQLETERAGGQELCDELARVEGASCAHEESEAALDAHLDSRAEPVELAIAGLVAPSPKPGNRLAITSRQASALARHGGVWTPERIMEGLLVRLFRDRIREAYVEALDAHYTENPPGLPAAERAARLAELREEILASERREEALVRSLEAQGAGVDRRPDVDPAVLLDVEFESAA